MQASSYSTITLSANRYHTAFTIVCGGLLLLGTVLHLVATALYGLSMTQAFFQLGAIAFAVGLLGLVGSAQSRINAIWYSLALFFYVAYLLVLNTELLHPHVLFIAELPRYLALIGDGGINSLFFVVTGPVALLGLALILGGSSTWRAKTLGRWSIMPLLLGVWLLVYIALAFAFDFSAIQVVPNATYWVYLPIPLLLGGIGLGLLSSALPRQAS